MWSCTTLVQGQENNCLNGITRTSCGVIKHGRVQNDNGRFSYGGRSERITVHRRFASKIPQGDIHIWRPHYVLIIWIPSPPCLQLAMDGLFDSRILQSHAKRFLLTWIFPPYSCLLTETANAQPICQNQNGTKLTKLSRHFFYKTLYLPGISFPLPTMSWTSYLN